MNGTPASSPAIPQPTVIDANQAEITAPTLPATPAPAPATSGVAETDAKIEAWFQKHFHGLGAKLTVEVYNALHAAKEDLLRILGDSQ